MLSDLTRWQVRRMQSFKDMEMLDNLKPCHTMSVIKFVKDRQHGSDRFMSSNTKKLPFKITVVDFVVENGFKNIVRK